MRRRIFQIALVISRHDLKHETPIGVDMLASSKMSVIGAFDNIVLFRDGDGELHANGSSVRHFDFRSDARMLGIIVLHLGTMMPLRRR